MKPPLRRIAITVTEPLPDLFGWQLLEQGADGEWAVIKTHSAPTDRYASSMAAGLVQLERLVGDLDKGPRQTHLHLERRGARARAAPDGAPDQAAHERPLSEATPLKRGPLFGFGPLR
ncbi:hypothetical protein [Polaromonas sp.]|uniref:hypothetical protein n=1 Tax=Polaromonas sp. TaxID=1869339 RepID=UPI00352A2E33